MYVCVYLSTLYSPCKERVDGGNSHPEVERVNDLGSVVEFEERGKMWFVWVCVCSCVVSRLFPRSLSSQPPTPPLVSLQYPPSTHLTLHSKDLLPVVRSITDVHQVPAVCVCVCVCVCVYV